jgi:hypothetical protein
MLEFWMRESQMFDGDEVWRIKERATWSGRREERVDISEKGSRSFGEGRPDAVLSNL